MTRREAIFIGLGLPAWAAAKEFWNEKKPEDWTEEERHEIMTRSPWARDADVKYNAGPGSLGQPRSPVMTRRGGTARTGTIPDAPSDAGHYASIVRWESALPILLASQNKSKDDPAAHYILSLVGDLPMLGRRSNDETEDEYQARLDNLKQYTRLEKRGGPIYLVKIGYQSGPAATSGALFYFERNDLITLHDGQVTFVTKLGPIEVKCKFPLKEMVYQGKLEL